MKIRALIFFPPGFALTKTELWGKIILPADPSERLVTLMRGKFQGFSSYIKKIKAK